MRGSTTDPLAYNTKGIYTIRWTFTDSNNNTSVATQTVEIVDNQAPTKPTIPLIEISCGTSPTIPTTTDNCAGTIDGKAVYPDMKKAGLYTIEWVFDDGNGNSTKALQEVRVVDNTSPLIPPLKDLEVSCGASLESPYIIDSCSGLPLEVKTAVPVSFDREGTYVVEWVFTDINNNKSTALQNVKVTLEDEKLILPDLSTLTDRCNVVVPRPFATDSCNGDKVYGTTEDPLIYTEIGVYTVNWVFTDRFGEKTHATQLVEVVPDREVFDEIEACNSFTWINEITYFENNNTDSFVEVTEEGCEVIHHLDLSLTKVDVNLSQDGNTLYAFQEGALYQWYRCGEDEKILIPGATSRGFTPLQNGNYAVNILYDGCAEMSECFDFAIDVEIAENENIAIFPNPPSDRVLNIVMSKSLTFIKVELMSVDNRVFFRETYAVPVSSTSINLPKLAPGSYFVRLINEDGTMYVKQLLIQ